MVIAAIGLVAAFALLSSDKKTVSKPFTPKISGGAVEFIVKMYPFALAASRLFPGVPWQLFLTFSGLESGFGKHAPEWNFFGTKPGKNYKGKTQLLTTHEILPKKTGYNFPVVISVTDSVAHPGKYDWKVKDNFRAYASPLDAFKDFGAFVSKGCYKKALTLPTINEKIASIKNCGYATDPNYIAKQLKLVALVEQTVKKFVN